MTPLDSGWVGISRCGSQECAVLKFPGWLLWPARCGEHWSVRAICLVTKKSKSWNSKGRSLKERISLSPPKILGRLWLFKAYKEKLLWLKQKRCLDSLPLLQWVLKPFMKTWSFPEIQHDRPPRFARDRSGAGNRGLSIRKQGPSHQTNQDKLVALDQSPGETHTSCLWDGLFMMMMMPYYYKKNSVVFGLCLIP